VAGVTVFSLTKLLSSKTDPPARATSFFAHAARSITNLQKARSPKTNTRGPGDSACSSRFKRFARDHAANAARSRENNFAPPALVSFIAVPQSMEVPLRGPLHFSNFFFPFFQSFLRNIHRQAARAVLAARCHLRLALPSKSQMTTLLPRQGEHR
jgi:hypothetical protein